jgi:hypothetical protein
MNKIAAIAMLTLLCTVALAQQMPSGYKSRQVQAYIDSIKRTSAIASERYYYDKEGNGILELKLKNGVDKKQVFENREYKSYMSILFNMPFYSLTQKAIDEADYRMGQRRKDAAFAEIEKGIKEIAAEYQYDFATAFTHTGTSSEGMEIKYRNPNIKKAVCDGYATAVVEKFKNHPLVASAEKWVSKIGKHAWNVLVLKDGRKIYADATWYQSNYIDADGYVADYPWKETSKPTWLTFDIDEFNSDGGGKVILFDKEETKVVNATIKKLKVFDKAVDNMETITKAGTPLKIHFGWEDAERTIPPPDASAKKASVSMPASATMYCVVYIASSITACTEFKNTDKDKDKEICDTQRKGLGFMNGTTVWTATKPTSVRCGPPGAK